MHSFLLHNGAIRPCGEKLLSPGQVGFMNGWGVFSTLRVEGGTLFAFERHYARMRHDAARMRVSFDLTAEELRRDLLALVQANLAIDAVLRVAVVRNGGGLFEDPRIERASDVIAFTAPLADWGEGVHLSYVHNGRFGASPFSGAKITSWADNLTWYEQAHENGFDEVVLLNEKGEVSECTSANIFVVEAERVFTPPLASSGCLPGVTRAILLEEIRVKGIEISERAITPSELEAAECAFITSTTRDLLQVMAVDGVELKRNTGVLQALRKAFATYRETYRQEAASRPVLVHS